MANQPTYSGPKMKDVAPWAEELQEHGYRVRVVLAFEKPAHVRVSVTLAKQTPAGFWQEHLRDGELVSAASSGMIEKVALRACARLLARVDCDKEYEQASYIVDLPPLPPAA